MDNPILIPVLRQRIGGLKTTLCDRATIEQEAIWDHCFDSLPSQHKSGAWLQGSDEAQEWMRVLLATHGAEIRKD